MARSDPPRTAAEPPRVPRRRRALPGGRAVVGGLLVTVAVIGVLATYAGANRQQGSMFVTAAHDLPAGHRLTAADLHLEQLDLPDTVSSGAYRSATELEGGVTLGPLGENDLVSRSTVLEPDASSAAPSSEFSFALDEERALNGDLRPGERVDLLATYGSGSDAYTMVVARHVPVLGVSSASKGTIGSGGKVVLSVALPNPDDVLAVAHASETAAVTVVRATRAEDTAPGADTYRPSPSGAGATGRPSGS